MSQHRREAFTLVELLVVIGIIAVLISILLPSLNKARQAANFVDCQSRLRQMGTTLHIYVNDNKGFLPWGVIDHDKHPLIANDSIPNPSYREQITWWYFTLSQVMTKRLAEPDGFVRNLSPIFRDRDTIQVDDARYVNHYTCNPRILYFNERESLPVIFGTGPEIEPQDRIQRKLTQVKRPSDAFVIWDGPQTMAPDDVKGNTYGIASALDAWGMYATHGLCFGRPGVNYDRPILPGQLGVRGLQPGKAFQKKYNFDLKHPFDAPDGWLSHLRFRHMNNTRLAALCLDGHVEAREVGTVMVKDIFTNFSNPK